MDPVIPIDPASEPVRMLVLSLDLCGTAAFALSGAMAAIRRRLDVFGVLMLAFVASTFGGAMRDLLIGSTPPAALKNPTYLAVSVVAGLVAFFWAPLIEKVGRPVRLFDAAGLAFFSVAGAEKALAFGVHPVSAIFLGMLTGVGGGMARDILLAEVPTVLRRELYAIAALVGAGIVVGGDLLGLPYVLMAIAGGLACFALRVMAILRGWSLPLARGKD